MIDTDKRAWAEVSESALRENFFAMRAKLPAGCKFMGLVKADAYGHGLVPVAKLLEQFGADYLAVACLDEAEGLRIGGVKLPILILGYTPAQYILRVAKAGATQTVGSLFAAEQYSKVMADSGETLKVHFKLETGMGRTGFDVKKGDISSLCKAMRLPGLETEGVFTHFAVSDEPEGGEYTRRQFECFMQSVEKAERETGLSFRIKHCANSGAFVNYPETYLDMVRPGIALFGTYPDLGKSGLKFTPVLSLRCRIADVHSIESGDCVGYGCTFKADKPMKVAVLPIGYGDGLHRVLSGKLEVLINGVRCRQIGRICMDMCMVDVTELPEVKPGDVATIIGEDGENTISANEVAEKAGTISYEIFCGFTGRIPRLYVK